MLDFNLLSYNHGAGLFVEGTGGGQAHYNVIKFNDDSGVLVRDNTNGSPAPTVQYSNIVANAVEASTLGRAGATAGTLLDTDHYEMTVTTTGAVTNAQYNYWTPTIGDVPSKIFDSRPGTGVNYQGYTGAEYPNLAVPQVGPRP